MSSQHDEFENLLLEYCETTVVPAEEVSIPLTLRNYERTIEANKGGSIFYDDESSIPWTSDENYLNATNLSVGDRRAYQDAMLLEEPVIPEEPVIRVTYGRGRGRHNITHRPGDSFKSLSDDDLQIQKYIRMVAPIGYRNEVTENAVWTIHRAKKDQIRLQQKSRKSTPKDSNTPSPSSSSNSEYCKFAMTSSDECKDTNNIKSSDNLSTLKGKSSSLTSSDQNETQPEELKIPSTKPNANDFVGPPVPESTIESSKSVPSISELLRMTMEQRRKNFKIAKAEREAQKEEDSIKTIKKLLTEDLKEEEVWKNRIQRSRSTSSSDRNYLRAEKEVLDWRQESNSPHFAWHQSTKQRRRKVFLNNLDDFPPLK